MVYSAAMEPESPVRDNGVNTFGLSINPRLPALLRAMADKLIPGIPHVTRIAILQQTGVDDESGGYGRLSLDMSVLDAVLSSDEARNETVRTAECENVARVASGVSWLMRRQSFRKASTLTIRWSLSRRFARFNISRRRGIYFSLIRMPT